MHLHILGICGTFMGGIARLAIEKGYKVTGSDQNCYPPMSTQLEALGIELIEGYDAAQLKTNPDCVIVGNAMARGVPVIEAMLNSNQKFTSGPQWLNENILQDKWVIAVAGTHGKTSTASMVTWILESNGYNPSFLIGGVMENFAVSARLTDSPFFVVEADEYDTAFFDKRSKFVHYRARTCIVNNLEFDHADIFSDLAAIETQFHHLVRTVPGNGLLIRPFSSESIERVVARGCWTESQFFSASEQSKSDWSAKKSSNDGSCFEVYFKGHYQATLQWSLIGEHNINNALAAIAAAHHVGIPIKDAVQSLADFKNVKRRMELKAEIHQIKVYDDFAHHPTAIATTLRGLRDKVSDGRILAVVDLRSNTMKMGIHKDSLAQSVKPADQTIFHCPENLDWRFEVNSENVKVEHSVEKIVDQLVEMANPQDTILIMSNGGFSGIHTKLQTALKAKWNH